MTISPFIVESLRRSRPYVVAAALLSVLLFSSPASAQFAEHELYFENVPGITSISSNTTLYCAEYIGSTTGLDFSVSRMGFYVGDFGSGTAGTWSATIRPAFSSTVIQVTTPDNIRDWVNENGFTDIVLDTPVVLFDSDQADVNPARVCLTRITSGAPNPNNNVEIFGTGINIHADWSTRHTSGITTEDPVFTIEGFGALVDEGPIGSDIIIPPGEYLVVNYPTNGTTTASTTITLDIDYDLPAVRSGFDSLLGSFCSQVEQLNGLPDCEHHTLATNLAIDTPTNVTPSVTLDYEGAYIGFISFWNGVDEDVECSWFDIWCEDETQELWETQAISFSSASTTVTLVTPFYRENLIAMCAQLPLGADYICEAMIWLFIPSTDVYVNATNQVWNQMAGKIPFGFFIYAKDTLGNVIEGTATSTYDGITVDLEVLGGETVMFDVQGVKNDEFYNRLIDTIDPYAEIFIWFLFVSYIWNRFRGGGFEGPAEGNLWGV